ncbi:MAG: hypothetical protein ABIP90_08605 [Vicinamibacterales bacterium]
MVNIAVAPTSPLLRIVAFMTLASFAWAASSCGKPTPAETPTVPEFERRIGAYLELENKAIADLPALKRTDDPMEITAREVAMGEAVRAARANAKQGDIITPQIAGYFKKLIKEDLQSRSAAELKLMKDEIPPFQPTVNQTYPSDHPLATFPATLLAVMPTLPAGLEYRFLTDALIIRDIKANLIIDYIRDVF